MQSTDTVHFMSVRPGHPTIHPPRNKSTRVRVAAACACSAHVVVVAGAHGEAGAACCDACHACTPRPSLSVHLSESQHERGVMTHSADFLYMNIGLLLIKTNHAGRHSSAVAGITRGSACARQGAASPPFNHQNPTKKTITTNRVRGANFPGGWDS